MSKNKNNRKKITNDNNIIKNNAINKELKSFILIISSIVLFLSIYTNFIGVLSLFFKKIIYNILGIGMFFIPFYLFYFGIITIKSKKNKIFNKKFLSVLAINIFLILLIANIRLNVSKEKSFFDSWLNILMYDNFINIHSGLIGHVLAFPLTMFLGYIGSYIFYFSGIYICSIIFLNIKLSNIGNYLEKFFLICFKKYKKIITKNQSEDINKNTVNIENTIPIKIKNTQSKYSAVEFLKNATIIEDNYDYKNNNKHPINYSKKVNNYRTIDKNCMYVPPEISLLKNNLKSKLNSEDKKRLINSSNKLQSTLKSFNIIANVTLVTTGPSVTRFELQPNIGTKVSKIVNLQDDIALALAATTVRVEAPIPGKSVIGIEIPNKIQTPVFLKEVLESQEFKNSKANIAVAFGKGISGKCIIGDLTKMPHTLIAGATGSGKSVCINSIIISIIYKYSPDKVKLLMIDPKIVELSCYNDIPHLLTPVVTDPKKAENALNWLINEMSNRYSLFAEKKVKNINSYNDICEKKFKSFKLPYIVVIIDELSDLMMVSSKSIESYICMLTQMARASGIHLIIATQRPSVDVITGLIKSNIPSRISFSVSSSIDSRTILDQVGAEKLLGKGDMLYYPTGYSKPIRVQGCFVSENEVDAVVKRIKTVKENIQYKNDISKYINEGNLKNKEINTDSDELIKDAINIIIESDQVSISLLQRKLKIGFNRSSRIIEELEKRKIISKNKNKKGWQVLISSKEEINI